MDIMTLAAAKSYTDKKTANSGATDLSNYYTKQEIEDKGFATADDIPSTEDLVAAVIAALPIAEEVDF